MERTASHAALIRENRTRGGRHYNIVAGVVRGPARWGVTLVLVSALLLSLALVDAVDVTSGSGVLAYSMETTCPVGWTDLSADPLYGGRLIKGWNPDNNTDIGALHLSNPSSGNEIIGHTHTVSRRLTFQGSYTQTPVAGSSPTVLSFAQDVSVTTDCGSSSVTGPTSNIQSEFAFPGLLDGIMMD
jgi:hypothetical protein